MRQPEVTSRWHRDPNHPEAYRWFYEKETNSWWAPIGWKPPPGWRPLSDDELEVRARAWAQEQAERHEFYRQRRLQAPFIKDQVLTLRASGHTLAEIGRIVGRSVGRVQQILAKERRRRRNVERLDLDKGATPR